MQFVCHTTASSRRILQEFLADEHNARGISANELLGHINARWVDEPGGRKFTEARLVEICEKLAAKMTELQEMEHVHEHTLRLVRATQLNIANRLSAELKRVAMRTEMLLKRTGEDIFTFGGWNEDTLWLKPGETFTEPPAPFDNWEEELDDLFAIRGQIDAYARYRHEMMEKQSALLGTREMTSAQHDAWRMETEHMTRYLFWRKNAWGGIEHRQFYIAVPAFADIRQDATTLQVFRRRLKHGSSVVQYKFEQAVKEKPLPEWDDTKKRACLEAIDMLEEGEYTFLDIEHRRKFAEYVLRLMQLSELSNS